MPNGATGYCRFFPRWIVICLPKKLWCVYLKWGFIVNFALWANWVPKWEYFFILIAQLPYPKVTKSIQARRTKTDQHKMSLGRFRHRNCHIFSISSILFISFSLYYSCYPLVHSITNFRYTCYDFPFVCHAICYQVEHYLWIDLTNSYC